jgi:hypothetical protein
MKRSIQFYFALILTWTLPLFSWTLVSSSSQGWPTRDITLHWNFSACTVTEDQLLTLLDQAIAAWNGVSGADLRLSRAAVASTATAADFIGGTVTGVPVILCDPAFGTTNSVDSDFIPAATRLSMPNGPIEYGGILLNAESGAAADLANISSAQITVILAHEIGHVLGLGHSSVAEALMYYSITDKTLPTISEDDQDGLSFLYPRNELSGGMFGCASTRLPNGIQPSSSSGGARTVLSALFAMATLIFSLRIAMQMLKYQI